jgi:hypothetical protein
VAESRRWSAFCPPPVKSIPERHRESARPRATGLVVVRAPL